ncbi:replication factor C subunit 2-like protein [Cricetulus griseus]|uniref:Replication factor C subunit 2-like protein n=1 Tax=Cricetulus griseus TaxID=10029 RepID=A0A061I2S0_CRIGR|nr:replication factor C subunit 2-like protein [Cricetulus griseus]
MEVQESGCDAAETRAQEPSPVPSKTAGGAGHYELPCPAATAHLLVCVFDCQLMFSEPIQSRCAVLRYTKLTDAQVLTRLMNVIEKEKVPYTDDGLEAIIFTAQGDMRQVCDEPHPLLVKEMIQHCVDANIDEAYKILAHLWHLGYSPEDIISNIFRVCKTFPMAEYLKLEFIKEIGYTHMKVAEGVNSLLQMAGLLARLCQKTMAPVAS